MDNASISEARCIVPHGHIALEQLCMCSRTHLDGVQHRLPRLEHQLRQAQVLTEHVVQARRQPRRHLRTARIWSLPFLEVGSTSGLQASAV